MSLDREKQLLAHSDEELVRLIERLDRDAKRPPAESKRSSERFAYRIGLIPCLTIDSGGVGRRAIIYPRNISAGGIAFVHRGFLHANTEVHLPLRRRSGDHVLIKGRVRACRHLSKMLHEIGVQFDEKINPSHYCEPEVIRAFFASRTRLAVPKVAGRVLVISDSPEEQQQCRTLLAQTGLEVDTSASAEAAAALKGVFFDAVIVDDELASIPPAELLRTLRAAEHAGPVICLTWTLTDEHMARFEPDDRTAFCQRPVDAPRLAQRLTDLLRPPVADPEPAAETPEPAADAPAEAA